MAGLQQSGQRLLQLLRDVLTFNTIEAGQLELQRVTFDARELCQAAIKAFADKARTKGVELSLTVVGEYPGPLQGDAKQIQSVVSVLLDNAIKFSEKGNIRVRIQMSAARPTALEIAVIDEGCGIAPDHLDALKQPFNQVDGSTTRKVVGIGMGLTLAKQLLHLMGLKLAMQSEPGRGSTFSFRLPMTCVSSPMKTDLPTASSRAILVQ